MRVAFSIALLMVGVLVVPSVCSDPETSGWFDRYVSSPIRAVSDFASGAYHGAGDMLRAYNDMKEANTIGADKYFHARGNHDAAQRGSGGRFAATVISNAREALQGSRSADSRADQEANIHGRNGGDPNDYRPEGLDPKY